MELICKHDINVFINRQLIYNYPEQLFADKGVMAIEHADFDGIERLALVTGGEIVSTFGKPELVKVKRFFNAFLGTTVLRHCNGSFTSLSPGLLIFGTEESFIARNRSRALCHTYQTLLLLI